MIFRISRTHALPAARILSLASAILALALLGACSQNATLYRQALKEYNHGDYETALKTEVKALKRQPDYAKNQELVKKAYQQAIANREAGILATVNKAEPDMWEKLISQYKDLIAVRDLVRPINPLVDKESGETWQFEQKDYETKLDQSYSGAADVHYRKGLTLAENSDDPEAQRQAATEFAAALSFVPNYSDAAARLANAKNLSVKRVAVMAFEDKSGLQNQYGSLIDILTEGIIGKMVRDKTISEYIQIITRDQIDALLLERQFNSQRALDPVSATAVGSVLNAHEIMTGKVLQVNYVPPRTASTELRETKKMVVGQEPYTDKKGREKKRDVKGDVTCVYDRCTKTASVKVIASFSMIEVSTGKVKLQDTVSAEYSWSDIWARVITGDPRALSDLTMELVTKDEPFPPTEAEMVNLALDNLGREIVDRVRDYVK